MKVEPDEVFALILMLCLVGALFVFAGTLLAGIFAFYGSLGCVALHYLHKIW